MTAPRPITADDPLTGGCLCGRLRYRVTAPPVSTSHCHCTLCRRANAAGFVTWSTVPRDAFSFDQGIPKDYAWSPRAVRQFCPDCGSQLTFHFVELADEIDITCATLDEPGRVTPEYHTWVANKLPWIVLGNDGIPRHEEWGSDVVPDGV